MLLFFSFIFFSPQSFQVISEQLTNSWIIWLHDYSHFPIVVLSFVVLLDINLFPLVAKNEWPGFTRSPQRDSWILSVGWSNWGGRAGHLQQTLWDHALSTCSMRQTTASGANCCRSACSPLFTHSRPSHRRDGRGILGKSCSNS